MPTKRLYALFSRDTNGRKWTRISSTAATKETAIRIFQNQLLHSALGGTPGKVVELRPIPKGTR